MHVGAASGGCRWGELFPPMPSPQAGATSPAMVAAAVEGGRRQTGTGVATRMVQGHPASREYRSSAAPRVGVATATTTANRRHERRRGGCPLRRGDAQNGWVRRAAYGRAAQPVLVWAERATPPAVACAGRATPLAADASGGSWHAGKPTAATTKKRQERYGSPLGGTFSLSQRWVLFLYCTSSAGGGAATARFPRCATAAGIRRQHNTHAGAAVAGRHGASLGLRAPAHDHARAPTGRTLSPLRDPVRRTHHHTPPAAVHHQPGRRRRAPPAGSPPSRTTSRVAAARVAAARVSRRPILPDDRRRERRGGRSRPSSSPTSPPRRASWPAGGANPCVPGGTPGSQTGSACRSGAPAAARCTPAGVRCPRRVRLADAATWAPRTHTGSGDAGSVRGPPQTREPRWARGRAFQRR